MDHYKGKYRIQSHRMRQWNYSAEGMYFITLVTQHRQCLLGNITQNKMILSDMGHIVQQQWVQSFDIRHELT